MNNNNILGVVLAGGKSRRFGEDKNQVKLGNMTLLDRTLFKIRREFKEILIVSNKDLKIKKLDKINLIYDFMKDLGPLGGVLSAMKWVKNNNKKYKWIATFPCDTPFFDTLIIEKYRKKIKTNKSLLYFIKSNQKRHNIFGLWSIKLLGQLEDDLINNNFRKVEEWANKIGVKTIDVKDNKFNTFLNINTKKDLVEAKKLLKDYKDDQL